MSYRTHTAAASEIAVQHGTAAELDEAFGYEVDSQQDGPRYLVLNDLGNMEAFVLTGNRDELRALAQRILRMVQDPEVTFEPGSSDGGYLVRWTIDVDNEEVATAREAAEYAMESFTREGSIAHVFEVIDGTGAVAVDLDEDECPHDNIDSHANSETGADRCLDCGVELVHPRLPGEKPQAR